MKYKVAIVGAGFSGIKAARDLSKDRRFEVCLINDSPFFPRSKLRLAELLQKTSVKLRVGLVKTINEQSRSLELAEGATIKYDYLIVAVGMSLNAPTLEQDRQRANYCVVGGRETGVATAGLLAEQAIKSGNRISLVESSPRLLPSLSERTARVAEKRLRKFGVRIYTSTTAKKGQPLTEPDDKAETIELWTEPKPAKLVSAHTQIFKLNEDQTIQTVDGLRVKKNIFVSGRCVMGEANALASVQNGTTISRVVKKVATGENVPNSTSKNMFAAVPIGRRWSLVQLRGLVLSGKLGWLTGLWLKFEAYRQIMPLKKALKLAFEY